MKFRFVSLLASLLALTLSPLETGVQAVPPLPASIFGNVKTNNANVPVDLQVEALMGETVVASGLTRMHEGDSIYSLIIPGDDPDTSLVEGPVSGEEVHFRVDGVIVEQVFLWYSGASKRLDLEMPVESINQIVEPAPLVGNLLPTKQTEQVDESPVISKPGSTWYSWLAIPVVLVASVRIGMKIKLNAKKTDTG